MKFLRQIREKYYNYPILYDYGISFVIVGILQRLESNKIIVIPTSQMNIDFASDVGAIGLTVSGFVLTLITILLTLKSGQIISNENLDKDSNAFKIFLASALYSRAISILKNGVLSLIIISLLIYFVRLFFSHLDNMYLFMFNIIGLVIIAFTFLRCFYILGLILSMQKKV